jgi:hypothetical protein
VSYVFWHNIMKTTVSLAPASLILLFVLLAVQGPYCLPLQAQEHASPDSRRKASNREQPIQNKSGDERSSGEQRAAFQQQLPVFTLEPVAQIRAPKRIEASPEEKEEIAECIRNFMSIKEGETGLLGCDCLLGEWVSDPVFSPVGVFDFFGNRLTPKQLADERIKWSSPLRRLVELGPKSLPALLQSLGDSAGTELVVKVERRFPAHYQMMWFDDVLVGNPMNPLERRVLHLGVQPWTSRRDAEDQVEAYRVKVGDVCLAAIGQIVARDYEPVGYGDAKQSEIMVCSPVHNRELRSKIKAIWGGDDAAPKLLDSLLIDFATRVAREASGENWRISNNLQIAAAMRLLYYFPKETAPLIAARLDQLDVSSTGTGRERADRNSVEAHSLIDAVSWSNEPIVRKALDGVRQRAKDTDVMKSLHRIRKDAE